MILTFQKLIIYFYMRPEISTYFSNYLTNSNRFATWKINTFENILSGFKAKNLKAIKTLHFKKIEKLI